MKIYKRFYDQPKQPDGTEKENMFLGDFKILETIEEDMYSSMRVGEENGKIYLIIETEVSHHNAGSRFAIYEIKKLKKRD